MFATILQFLAPVLIRGIAWVLDYLKAKDQLKKQYYMFVSAYESEFNAPVRLAKGQRAQLDAIKKQLTADPQP